MALPTNDDFANRELSIEELEAIAAGGFWSWIKHEASVIAHDASVAFHWIESHWPNPTTKFPFPPGKL